MCMQGCVWYLFAQFVFNVCVCVCMWVSGCMCVFMYSMWVSEWVSEWVHVRVRVCAYVRVCVLREWRVLERLCKCYLYVKCDVRLGVEKIWCMYIYVYIFVCVIKELNVLLCVTLSVCVLVYVWYCLCWLSWTHLWLCVGVSVCVCVSGSSIGV